jgi:hypothetical protein
MDAGFLEIYAVYGGGDDRRAPDELVGYFSHASVAEQHSKGKGWYGGPGRVAKELAITLGADVYVLKHPDPVDLDQKEKKAREELKLKALAKLSREEQIALGLLKSR